MVTQESLATSPTVMPHSLRVENVDEDVEDILKNLSLHFESPNCGGRASAVNINHYESTIEHNLLRSDQKLLMDTMTNEHNLVSLKPKS